MNARSRTVLLVGSGLLLAGTLGATPALEWDGVDGDMPTDGAGTTVAPRIAPFGSVVVVTDRVVFVGASTTVNFDDAAHHDAVNDRYADVGIAFDREDGCCIHAYDVCGCGFETSSPPMMACATRGPGAPWIGNSLAMHFDRDVHSAGFVIGNDRTPGMIFTIELLDHEGLPVGAVWYAPNGNIHADEFVGVASLVPFRTLRVSHTLHGVAMCVDDVTFSTRTLALPGLP